MSGFLATLFRVTSCSPAERRAHAYLDGQGVPPGEIDDRIRALEVRREGEIAEVLQLAHREGDRADRTRDSVQRMGAMAIGPLDLPRFLPGAA